MANLRAKLAMERPLLILIGFLTCLVGGCSKRGQIDNQVSIASPCVLVSEPSEHNGQRIKLTGYITSTKEGAYMWGDGCKTSGVVLHMGRALVQDTRFRDALFKHGLSPFPIKATLLGRFQYSRFSGVKTFDAERVLELQVSPTTEAQPGPKSSRYASQRAYDGGGYIYDASHWSAPDFVHVRIRPTSTAAGAGGKVGTVGGASRDVFQGSLTAVFSTAQFGKLFRCATT